MSASSPMRGGVFGFFDTIAQFGRMLTMVGDGVLNIFLGRDTNILTTIYDTFTGLATLALLAAFCFCCAAVVWASYKAIHG